MARRVVQECDLTKQEYDPAETVTLVIKKNGKKTGRTYELSSAAASKLEQQLVSGNSLPENWSFGSAVVMRDTSAQGGERRTLADLDTDNLPDDSEFVAAKKKEMAGTEAELEVVEDEVLPEPAVGADDCHHLNKGPIQTTMNGGKRKIYRTCRDCRKRINEKTKDEKASFLGAKAPPDTREGHSPVARKRNES